MMNINICGHVVNVNQRLRSCGWGRVHLLEVWRLLRGWRLRDWRLLLHFRLGVQKIQKVTFGLLVAVGKVQKRKIDIDFVASGLRGC